MARLTKQQIFEAPLRTAEVEVPEWGGDILVGEWPVERTGEIMAMFGKGQSPEQNPDFMVTLFIMGCLDPIFSAEDAEELRKKSGAVMLRVTQRIMSLNGLSESSQDEARGKF